MFVNIPDTSVIHRDDCYFYHSFDFPDGEVVCGNWDLRGRFEDYIGGVDLSGQSFLDIGTASGFLSFEAERRGAKVVSFDMDTPARQHLLPFSESAYTKDWSGWVREREPILRQWHNSYFVAHNKFSSNARLFHGDIYSLPRDMTERFDVVLLGCIIEHLSNPLLAIQSAAQMAKSTLIVTERLVHDSNSYVAVFQGRRRAPSNNYVWWKLSRGVYREFLAIIGFEIESEVRNEYSYKAHRAQSATTDSTVKLTTMVCRRT